MVFALDVAWTIVVVPLFEPYRVMLSVEMESGLVIL